jgi:hypothetical protein
MADCSEILDAVIHTLYVRLTCFISKRWTASLSHDWVCVMPSGQKRSRPVAGICAESLVAHGSESEETLGFFRYAIA